MELGDIVGAENDFTEATREPKKAFEQISQSIAIRVGMVLMAAELGGWQQPQSDPCYTIPAILFLYKRMGMLRKDFFIGHNS